MAKQATADDPNVKVFTLGDHGVNLTTSPLHVEPGELASAQNAVFSLIQAKHALSKRPGMDKLNASAAAGAVLAFQSIPLADPAIAMAAGEDRVLGTVLYAFSSDSGGGVPNNQTQSADSDPSTWTQPAGHQLASGATGRGEHLLHEGYTLLGPKSIGTAVLNWGGVYESYDGTSWTDVFTIPTVTISADDYAPDGVVSSDQDAINYYIAAHHTKTTGGGGPSECILVWQISRTTYAITQLGEGFLDAAGPFGGMIVKSLIGSLATYDNKVWVAGRTTTTTHAARVWSISPGGTAWTQDMTLGGTGAGDSYDATYVRLCGHGRQLWCGWRRSGATTKAIFRKRENDLWTTVAEGLAGGYGYYEPVYALGDTMYAWLKPDPAGTTLKLYVTTDGGATLTNTATIATNLYALGRAFRWNVDNKIYGVVGPSAGGSTFQIWELLAAAAVFTDPAAGAQHHAGLFGAAKAPAVIPTTPYTPDPGTPADPVLPTAPASVMAKCAAYRSTTLAIGALRDVPTSFEAVTFNVGTMWVATKASILTVPYGGGGYYGLTAQLAWDNAAGTRGFWAKIRVNGQEVARGYAEGNVTSGYVFCRASVLVKLADGDTIDLIARQLGPGNWNLIGGASYTFLHAIRLL